MYKIMTPGPTQVAENVRLARSRECTNPDLDESFVEFYKETCEEISRLLHTDNETLILGGEGNPRSGGCLCLHDGTWRPCPRTG